MQIECRISSLLEYYAEMQLILCKITLFFRKMQEIYGKMFESEDDKKNAHPWYGK